MTRDEDVNRFIDLVEGWNASGWAEYLLWEVLSGTRTLPFWLVEQPLSEERAILARLRDEHRVWPFFFEEGREWRLAPIDAWASHAEVRTSAYVLQEMQAKHELQSLARTA